MGTRLVWGVVFFLSLSCVVGNVAHAQIPSQLIPNCDFYHGETYGLGAFVQLGVNVMKFIWGIAGSLALVMFVWGGFQWLTAAGEESKVKSGWATLINAGIGMIIVFGSWVAINTVVVFLTSPSGSFDTAKLFNSTETWVALVGKDTVCIKVGAHITGNVPATVKADCGIYCEEEAVKRGMSYLSSKAEACTPGAVDTGSGSAGYTKVCIEKRGSICNCELLPVAAGTVNCGALNCKDATNNLFCEPTNNQCKNRLTENQKCRQPAIERECAGGLQCKKDSADGIFKCTKIPNAAVTGICCYHTVNESSTYSGKYGVAKTSGTMTKQACYDERPNKHYTVLGGLGIRWAFCPGGDAAKCGASSSYAPSSSSDPLSNILAPGSSSTKWDNLIPTIQGSSWSGCTLFVPQAGGTVDQDL